MKSCSITKIDCMFHKYLIFNILLFFGLLCNAETVFNLKWHSENLPFDVKTARATTAVKRRVGETGTFSEKLNLPISNQMPDGKIALNNSENGYVYLFIKNNSKKNIRFSVAPHSTHPGASALGFVFNCLCNGHVYTAKPNQIWYRIMELKNDSTNRQKDIELTHHIFEIKK